MCISFTFCHLSRQHATIYLVLQFKVKVEFTLERATKAQRENSCTFVLTSALVGVGGQHYALAAFPPGWAEYLWYIFGFMLVNYKY